MIAIPPNITKIGDNAFCGCTLLEKVLIPTSVTSIGKNAFKKCMSLTKKTIPSSVTTIEESAFYLCTSLTHISMPFSMESIGQSAFGECSSLTQIIIPFGIHSIEDNTFSSCSSLRSVTISSSVTSIGKYSFAHCIFLDQLKIPPYVVLIDDYAFSFCNSLSNLIIPSSVNRIGKNAFANCNFLRSVTIPSSVKKIENDAFQGCNNLETNISDFDVFTDAPFVCVSGCILFVLIISYFLLGLLFIFWWSKLYPWFEHGYKSGKKVYKLLETTWISLILELVFIIVFNIIKKIYKKRWLNIPQYMKRYTILIFISVIVYVSLYLVITICAKKAISYGMRKDVVDGKNIKCLKYILEGVEGARDWVSKQSEKKQKAFEKWYDNLQKKAFIYGEASDYFCEYAELSFDLIVAPLIFYLCIVTLAFILFITHKCIHKH